MQCYEAVDCEVGAADVVLRWWALLLLGAQVKDAPERSKSHHASSTAFLDVI